VLFLMVLLVDFNSSSNILRMVKSHSSTRQASSKPFIMTFVGVNGVGKSTSLSKVAHYLKNHGLNVMIVACDTFRCVKMRRDRNLFHIFHL